MMKGSYVGFVVGLNRDRDSYHVPAALAEVGELDAFVTDYYEGVGPRIPTLGHRRSADIDSDLVTASYGALMRQLPYEVKRRIRPATFPTYPVELWLGRTVADVAKKNPDSDLLIYSGSAMKAFEGDSRGRRILFQYHPSPDFIAETMEGLDELESLRPWRKQDEVLNPRMTRDHHREVAASELALCASSFTARGLASVGMAPENTVVVPYGCPTATTELPPKLAKTRFLFCGQGSQRKGLHILLTAWQEANLKDAELTLVSSTIDPQIAEMIEQAEGVRLLSGLSRAELDQQMLEADTFVLPSLLEGFGLVIGEALAQGCRVIATSNTGLVDLDVPDHLATVIEPGKVQPLVEALRDHAQSAQGARPYHREVVDFADEHNWALFRAGIRKAVGA